MSHTDNKKIGKLEFETWDENQVINLTCSQETVLEESIKLLPIYKILVIKGDSRTGKNTVAKKLFEKFDAIVENFDLCELSEKTSADVSNQHVCNYLKFLLNKLEIQMGSHPNRKSPGIIYIRHYNRVVDTLSDYQSKLRFLLPLIFKTFTESLPRDVRIVITGQSCPLPEGIYWSLDLSTTKLDMEFVMKPYLDNKVITDEEIKTILKISKIIPVGRLLYCLNYSIATSTHENPLLDQFQFALSKFSGSTVNVEEDVPNVIVDDLVGVEDIIDEVTTSIIIPMKLDIPGISIKKGILLCGPPGTGKTSIGKWLAHQLHGKFYLIGPNNNGISLVEIFESTVNLAKSNSPAVIFIDDCDSLFDNHELYRAFLTILDGIETNKRTDVCIILTCMNLRNVPSSLLRGGRLELTLVTRLPDHNKIKIILSRILDKMVHTIFNYDQQKGKILSSYITSDFIDSIASKMHGWNCADINRCVNDVSRLIIAEKGTHITQLFDKTIQQIIKQYTLCGHCESTNLDDFSHQFYIT